MQLYESGALSWCLRNRSLHTRRIFSLANSQPSAALIPFPTTLPEPLRRPRDSPTLGSPFLRAYAPILSSYGISSPTFFNFLDNLNRISVANPPLQILGLAGNIVGFLPVHTAQLVGLGVQVASKAATVAVSKGRTEQFLQQANKELFGPAGLEVEIAKLDALAKLARMPILNAEGKVDKHASILEPLRLDGDVHDDVSGQQRRLNTLAPCIERLDLTPQQQQVNVPDNALSKLSAGASERMRRRGEAKLLKERSKAAREYGREAGKAEREYEREMGKLDRKEKRGREWEKIEKGRARVRRQFEREMGRWRGGEWRGIRGRRWR